MARRPAIVLILALLALAAGPAVPAANAACEDESIAIKAKNLSKARAALRCLVNAERTGRGTKKLSANDKLTRAAQSHAEDMEKRDYFDHDTPEGKTAADRVLATGYEFTALGENIARGYATPKAAVKGWMKSKGHRDNILGQQYTEFGLGVAKGKTYVNVFAAR